VFQSEVSSRGKESASDGTSPLDGEIEVELASNILALEVEVSFWEAEEEIEQKGAIGGESESREAGCCST